MDIGDNVMLPRATGSVLSNQTQRPSRDRNRSVTSMPKSVKLYLHLAALIFDVTANAPSRTCLREIRRTPLVPALQPLPPLTAYICQSR